MLILSERLHVVTSQFDQLRAFRFQDTINRAMPRRKVKKVAPTDTTNSMKHNDYQGRGHINSDVAEPSEIQAEPKRIQQQLLDDETRALQVSNFFEFPWVTYA